MPRSAPTTRRSTAPPGPDVRSAVLVTGAAGFAGSHLLDLLEASPLTAWGHRAVAADHDQRAQWRVVDILDAAAVDREIASSTPDLIYHCAGVAQAGSAWDRTGATFAVNVRGLNNLLTAVERHAPRARVVAISSALIYRQSPDVLTEDSVLGPAGPYAVSKLAQEMLAASAAARGLDVVIARPFNHIGPRQSADFVASSVARQVALIERGQLPPTLQVGNLAAQRDFTDVRDVVRAYIAIAEHAAAGEVFNICSGHAVAIHDLVHGLVARSRVPIEVVVDPSRFRPVDVPVVVGSADRLQQRTGWTARIPLDQTLDDLLDWWRTRPD